MKKNLIFVSTGTLVSSFPGVEFGPLHYRHIETDKELNLNLNKGNFDSHMTLSHDSLDNIRWWSSNIQTATRKILHNSPDVDVYTDASQMGWGAHIDHGNNTSCVWSKSESLRHINYLELLAVRLALASLLDSRSNIHVRIMITLTQSLISILWMVVRLKNATLLLNIFGIGLGKEKFGCQQPIFRDLAMLGQIGYLGTQT